MKICVVIAWSFEVLDGSTWRVYFLLKELIDRGHDVIVLHASEAGADYTEKNFGCRTASAGVEINRWDSYKKKIVSYMKFVIRASKIVRKMDCDKVFGISLVNSLPAIKHRKAEKIIMFVDFMSNYFKYAHKDGMINNILYMTSRFLERYAVKKSDKCIIITEALKEILPPELWAKTEIIPDGADTQYFRPGKGGDEVRKKYGVRPGDYVIGYQGGIESHDGLQFLARVSPMIIKDIPGARFLIAGRGSYLDEIIAILKDNGTYDSYIFTGWLDSSEMPGIMSITDLNVVPIPNHPATAPLITFRLLESMAAGVSVIVNDLPGIREVADETMVFFSNIENREKFCNDIVRIANMPTDKIEEVKRKAREKIETLDWRQIASRDADVIEKGSSRK